MVRPTEYIRKETVGEASFKMWLALLEDIYPQDESPRYGSEYRMGTTGKTVGGKDFVKGSECQKDNVAPSLVSEEKGRERLYKFIRVRAYSDDDKGKDAAERFADKTREEFEGELNVKVRRVYCRDLGEYRWTVWVKQVELDEDRNVKKYAPRRARRTVKKRQDGKLKTQIIDAGGFQFGREWGQFRGVAKRTVSCPKCQAPVDEPCVKDMEFYARGDNLENYTATQRRKIRTNPHKERVIKYLEENQTKDEVEQKYRKATLYTDLQQKRMMGENEDGEV